MDQKLNSLCDLFIRNRDIIKSEFFWENSYIYPVCAAIFMEKGRTADPERMEECKRILITQGSFLISEELSNWL